MKLYHGSANTNIKIKSQYPSRYGFTALFLTEDQNLALNYAKHKRGALYEVEIMHPEIKLNFGGKSTYHHHQDFIKILKYYKNMGYPSIRINNALVSPNIKTIAPGIYSIVVVFNPKIITNIKKISTHRR